MQDESVLANHSPWFEHLSSPQDCRFRLFCFPYAGASAQIFRPWRRHFPREIDVCLVHLPGRGRRINERPFTRLKLLVNVIAEIMDGELGCRFAFYGHSMGGLIGFELSREIRRRYHIEPLHLFISGRRAPQVPSSRPPSFDLPEQDFIETLNRLNGTPQELLDNAETRKLFLPLLRADFEMVDTYEYAPDLPLCCPITTYTGLQDKYVSRKSVDNWNEQTLSTHRQRWFPGDHFFIQDPRTDFIHFLRKDVIELLQ